MNICFTELSFKDYKYWQKKDKKISKKINDLIKNIQRTPFSGLGKTEALKGNLAGYYSRRIDHEHRLVYTIEDENLIIISCRYHY